MKARQTATSPASMDAPVWAGGIAPAPLLPGEDMAEYAKFNRQFLAAVKPRDFIEEVLTRDAIDLSWEILRLRALKGGLLRMACSDGVRKVTRKLDPNPRPLMLMPDVGAKWMNHDSETRNDVQKLLKKADLGMEEVMAEALSSNLKAFERFDRLLASNEARRNNALREIDRHRLALGGAVRQAVEEVEDADFRDVETGELSGGPLA